MRRALIVVFILANFGVCSAAFAVSPDDCRAQFDGCMKACSTDQQCQSNCYEGVGFCLNVARQGKKPFFRDAATAVGAVSAPATTSGAKNVNPGSAATTTTKIETVGVQTINPGAATATTTTNAPPLSAPAKPSTAISNGVLGHASGGQLGRGNLRVQ